MEFVRFSVRRIVLSAGAVAAAGILSLSSRMVQENLQTRAPTSYVYAWARDLIEPSLSASRTGDGGNALDMLLQGPAAMRQDVAGNVYVSDRNGRFIWKIDSRGTAHVIAGTGRKGVARSGIRAIDADLGSPEGLYVAHSGDVFFVDRFVHSVFKITRDGMLYRVAGTLRQGYSGDGGPATDATLREPYGLAGDSRGNLYIADYSNACIRKIGPDGIITTVAGRAHGSPDEGVPAREALLRRPYNVYVAGDDSLLIAESGSCRIRRVDRDGRIYTIAGNGQRGYSGDGGPALEARMDEPQALFLDDRGRLYIGDEHNHCIRIVEPSGIIRTLAGVCGQPGLAEEGMPVGVAPLNDPEDILLLKNGLILIAERGNSRIRAISPDGFTRTWAGGRHSKDQPSSATAKPQATRSGQ